MGLIHIEFGNALYPDVQILLPSFYCGACTRNGRDLNSIGLSKSRSFNCMTQIAVHSTDWIHKMNY